MKAKILRIGNSQGVILPKPLLAQVDLSGNEVEMTVERGAIVLRKPQESVRDGWAEAAQNLAEARDGGLAWPEFSNEGDAALTW